MITTAFINYALEHGWEVISKHASATQTNNIVLFNKDELHFIFIHNKDDDPNYFEIILPDIDDVISDNIEQSELLSRLNREYKTGKVIMENNQIALSFEQYVFSDINITKLFEQAIGCLEAMIREYRRTMRIVKQNTQNS